MNHKENLVFRYWLYSILIILLFALIWYLRQMIAPLVIAALLAYVLNPLVDYLEKRTRLGRAPAVTLVFLAAVGAMAVSTILILPILVAEIQGLETDLSKLLTMAQEFMSRPLVILQWEFLPEALVPDTSGLLSDQLSEMTRNLFEFIESTTINLIWSLVILVTTYYLLRDYSHLRDTLLGLTPEPYRATVNAIYQEIKAVWNGYLRGNLALMAIVGVVFTLLWFAIGLPGALILGIIAGFLTIIPDLGPSIAAGLAIVVALFEGSNYLPISNIWFALLVLGTYLLLINIKTIWLRPRIYGQSVHMHDGVVFVAIMVAVVLEGVLGALIVVPVLASLGVIAKYIFRALNGMPSQSEESEEMQVE